MAVTKKKPAERMFAVAIRDGDDLFLWIRLRRSKSGDIYYMFPTGWWQQWTDGKFLPPCSLVVGSVDGAFTEKEENDPSAMNNLALLLATSKNERVRNPQEAVALATKAVAAANNPDYLDTLAAAYFAAGQTDKAIDAEQKALAMNPGNDAYKESLQKYLAANGGR